MISRLKHLNVFFKDPNKKGELRILWEIIYFAVIKKTIPTDYFRKFLYRKECHNYLEYLSTKEYYKIIESNKMVFPEIASILQNKLSFACYCKNYLLPTPKLLSYNIKNHYFTKNGVEIVNSNEDLLKVFKTVMEDNSIDLFLKPIQSQGGQGCILLTKNTLKAQIDAYGHILRQNSYIHQNRIQQHSSISKIYPHAVNTMRLTTYIDTYQNIHIISGLMRFGIGHTITDNVTTGGFYVSVDMESGRLKDKGQQGIAAGGQVFFKHPNSNIILKEFEIPFFKDACSLVKQATSYFPSRIIGWDIAITNNGPVIIEGNERPSLHFTDVAYGGYLKNKYIREILTEIK